MRTLTVNSHQQVEMIDITDDVINCILQNDIVEPQAAAIVVFPDLQMRVFVFLAVDAVAGLHTRNRLASPRKAKKPTTSVTVVRMMDED